MKEQRSIIAIIPARGGSKGISRKNIKLLDGKPLIYYTINEAQKSRYIQGFFVSTEDAEIAKVAKQYGCEVIPRPFELALDDTPSFPVYQQAIKYLEGTGTIKPSIVVILQPTSPLRTVDDIDNAIYEFLRVGCSSVVSVCEVEHPPEWMYKLDGDRLRLLLKEGNKVTRRQDSLETYRLNGAVYVTTRDIIMKRNGIIGADTRAYIMPQERSIDMDSSVDFALAEMMIKGEI